MHASCNAHFHSKLFVGTYYDFDWPLDEKINETDRHAHLS